MICDCVSIERFCNLSFYRKKMFIVFCDCVSIERFCNLSYRKKSLLCSVCDEQIIHGGFMSLGPRIVAAHYL